MRKPEHQRNAQENRRILDRCKRIRLSQGEHEKRRASKRNRVSWYPSTTSVWRLNLVRFSLQRMVGIELLWQRTALVISARITADITEDARKTHHCQTARLASFGACHCSPLFRSTSMRESTILSNSFPAKYCHCPRQISDSAIASSLLQSVSTSELMNG